jgi:hypothetical protein
LRTEKFCQTRKGRATPKEAQSDAEAPSLPHSPSDLVISHDRKTVAIDDWQ